MTEWLNIRSSRFSTSRLKDACSRLIVGYSIADRMTAQLAVSSTSRRSSDGLTVEFDDQ